MGLKSEMSQWIEEHIECCAYDIKDYKEPYSKQQLNKMSIPCAQLRILFDISDRFDIDINYKISKKYGKFANIKLS